MENSCTILFRIFRSIFSGSGYVIQIFSVKFDELIFVCFVFIRNYDQIAS